MNELSDSQLLTAYVESRSEAAFAELGNETAVRALIELAKAGDPNLQATLVAGLEGAANRQKTEALETLRLLGVR